jgi:2-oxo-4-hydroxy-4-carboxy-5-ureidoimidazoline decarboxylase
MAASAVCAYGASVPSPHELLNQLSGDALRAALVRCCGAQRWLDGMLAEHPFASDEALFASAERIWQGLSRADYLEAFGHHPRIGEDVAALRERFAATANWSSQEQAGVAVADVSMLEALAENNRRYLARFGYIFIVCASGKSAAEISSLLEARLQNAPEQELAIAACEQARITRLRLEKLST